MILHQIHRELTGVFLYLLVDAVVDVGFLKQDIAAVFLICKYVVYGAAPILAHRLCSEQRSYSDTLYPANRCAAQEHVVYLSDNLCLIRYYLRLAVIVLR